MAFVNRLYDSYEASATNKKSNFGLFNFLVVDGNNGAAQMIREFEGVKTQVFTNVVYILSPLSKVPMVYTHRKGDKGRILCNKTFTESCPACEAHEAFKTIYGTSYKEYPHGGRKLTMSFPLLLPLESQNPRVRFSSRGDQYKNIDIYWLNVSVAPWNEQEKKNFERIKNQDQTYPLHKIAHLVHCLPKVGENGCKRYAFEPTNPVEIKSTHPIITEYFKGYNQDGSVNWDWDDEYYETLFYLSLLQTSAYVDKEGQVFNYDGHLDRAYQVYEELSDYYPRPSTKVG